MLSNIRTGISVMLITYLQFAGAFFFFFWKLDVYVCASSLAISDRKSPGMYKKLERGITCACVSVNWCVEYYVIFYLIFVIDLVIIFCSIICIRYFSQVVIVLFFQVICKTSISSVDLLACLLSFIFIFVRTYIFHFHIWNLLKVLGIL